jgi:hypothetical protein
MFTSKIEHKIQVEVERVNRFGLESYKVKVNSVVAHEFLSEMYAWDRAGKLADRLGGELSLELKIAA